MAGAVRGSESRHVEGLRSHRGPEQHFRARRNVRTVGHHASKVARNLADGLQRDRVGVGGAAGRDERFNGVGQDVEATGCRRIGRESDREIGVEHRESWRNARVQDVALAAEARVRDHAGVVRFRTRTGRSRYRDHGRGCRRRDAALHFLDRSGVSIQQRNGLAAVHGRTAADRNDARVAQLGQHRRTGFDILVGRVRLHPVEDLDTHVRRAQGVQHRVEHAARRQIFVGHDQRGGLAERLDVVRELQGCAPLERDSGQGRDGKFLVCEHGCLSVRGSWADPSVCWARPMLCRIRSIRQLGCSRSPLRGCACQVDAVPGISSIASRSACA